MQGKRRQQHGALRIDKVLLGVMVVFFCIQISACNTSGSLSVRRIDGLLAEGQLLTDAQDHQGAAAYYREALLRYPNEEKLQYNLALALALDNDVVSALEMLRALDERSGGHNVRYLKAIGGIAASSSDVATAIQAWERVLDLDPLDNGTRDLLLDILASQQRFAEAYAMALGAFDLGQYSVPLFRRLAELQVDASLGDGTTWRLLAEEHGRLGAP